VSVDRALVLVVEDDDELRSLLVEELQAAGYDTVGLSDGAQALSRIRGEGPPANLILLDLQMPVLNGWELLALRETDPRLLLIPVIVMSGQHDAPLKMPRVHFIPKPVDRDRLLQLIAVVLEQASPDPLRLPRPTEPWTVDASNSRLVRNSFGHAVAYAGGEREARRIVAAVNAVSQISTAALESGIVERGLECLYQLHRYDTDPAYRTEVDGKSALSILLARRGEVASALRELPLGYRAR
jgi:CheY-like chemotaxis protein